LEYGLALSFARHSSASCNRSCLEKPKSDSSLRWNDELRASTIVGRD